MVLVVKLTLLLYIFGKLSKYPNSEDLESALHACYSYYDVVSVFFTHVLCIAWGCVEMLYVIPGSTYGFSR